MYFPSLSFTPLFQGSLGTAPCLGQAVKENCLPDNLSSIFRIFTHAYTIWFLKPRWPAANVQSTPLKSIMMNWHHLSSPQAKVRVSLKATEIKEATVQQMKGASEAWKQERKWSSEDAGREESWSGQGKQCQKTVTMLREIQISLGRPQTVQSYVCFLQNKSQS